MLTDPNRIDEEVAPPAPSSTARRRQGFLPIVTSWFDRLFIATYLGVAVELLWLRFLEAALPLTVAHVLVLALGALIVWKG